MENRTWKKPGKRFFKKKLSGNDGRYIPVQFNGKNSGWSDGYIAFFNFIPDDGIGNGPLKKDITQSIELNDYRSGNLMGGDVDFDNPLRYVCRIDDEDVDDGIAFFERMDGTKWSDWDYPVSIDDGYLNAIMYYAKKMYGKKAEVKFWLETKTNYKYKRYGSKKERMVPMLVTVNHEPFALLMPLSCNIKFEDLNQVPQAFYPSWE